MPAIAATALAQSVKKALTISWRPRQYRPGRSRGPTPAGVQVRTPVAHQLRRSTFLRTPADAAPSRASSSWQRGFCAARAKWSFSPRPYPGLRWRDLIFRRRFDQFRRDREMLWGGRRGNGTIVAASNRWSAAMPQPNDLSRSLVALDQNSTIVAQLARRGPFHSSVSHRLAVRPYYRKARHGPHRQPL